MYNLASSVLVPVGVRIHDMAAHDGIDDAMHSNEGLAYHIVMAVKYVLYVYTLFVLTYSNLKKWKKNIEPKFSRWNNSTDDNLGGTTILLGQCFTSGLKDGVIL